MFEDGCESLNTRFRQKKLALASNGAFFAFGKLCKKLRVLYELFQVRQKSFIENCITVFQLQCSNHRAYVCISATQFKLNSLRFWRLLTIVQLFVSNKFEYESTLNWRILNGFLLLAIDLLIVLSMHYRHFGCIFSRFCCI